MAQWNFVINWVMFAVAKVESRQSNQHCGESTWKSGRRTTAAACCWLVAMLGLVYRLRVKSVTSVVEAYTTGPNKERAGKVL
jgi:hypothetical protein